jgi:hypothetical protein
MTTDGPTIAQARALLTAYRDRQVTLAEAASAVETRYGRDHDPIATALGELFPLGSPRAPDPAVVDLAITSLELDVAESHKEMLLALSLRRPVLAAIVTRADNGEDIPLTILRPGCRVMFGTASGRTAIRALVDGELGDAAAWLERTVLDPEAFLATTLDAPLGDLAGLGELVDRLVRETELLPPGRARARVADEWVSEIMVDSLDDETPYTEIVRIVGERLLESDAPALLWHAAKQLSLVAGGDRRVAERVLDRCLPLARLEDGRSPAAAAAPFLTVLPAEHAARILERLAPSLDDDGWDAVSRVFLAGAFRKRWTDWRPHALRWAGGGGDAGLARAASTALTLAERAA